jgi:hypothetical protein
MPFSFALIFTVAAIVIIMANMGKAELRSEPATPRPKWRTQTISIARGTQLNIGRGAPGGPYHIEGWLELSTRIADGQQRVGVLNLRASQQSLREVRTDVSRDFHITVASDAVRGRLDLDAGTGSIDLDIVNGKLSLALATLGGHTELRASGTLNDFPPFSRDEIPFDFTSVPIDVRGEKCGSLCLFVDIANTGTPAQPLLTPQQLDQVIGEVNRIWGCPGQCCIRVRVEATRHDGRDTVNMRDGNEGDILAQGNIYRDLRRHARGCHIVMITGTIVTNTGGDISYDDLGNTNSGTEPEMRGTLVAAKRPISPLPATGPTTEMMTPVAIGTTLAHELGHAMGLANSTGADDAEGVRHHSTTGDNLMYGRANLRQADDVLRGNTKLNRLQCERARNSPLVRQTNENCGNQPRETL